MLDRDGVAIEALWWRAGGASAPAVLLTHPFDGDAYAVAPMAVALRDAGYHALAISMRGFGRSGGRDDCGLRQPDDLIAVLEWMHGRGEIDGDRLGLYGRSQGGMVAFWPPLERRRWSAPWSCGTPSPISIVGAMTPSTQASPRTSERCADLTPESDPRSTSRPRSAPPC